MRIRGDLPKQKEMAFYHEDAFTLIRLYFEPNFEPGYRWIRIDESTYKVIKRDV